MGDDCQDAGEVTPIEADVVEDVEVGEAVAPETGSLPSRMAGHMEVGKERSGEVEADTSLQGRPRQRGPSAGAVEVDTGKAGSSMDRGRAAAQAADGCMEDIRTDQRSLDEEGPGRCIDFDRIAGLLPVRIERDT